MADLERKALAIVEACLELDPVDRERLVERRCARSPELRARVDRLLAMDGADFRLLATGAAPAAAPPPPDPVPERIGAFRVTGIIGSGGMGTVVRAERDDGLYAQSVAIKLTRSELKDARAHELFARERRILARLSHPGIARILDGGAVDGRPYLVMELVEGRPITLALEERNAGLAETLACFEAVCAAVSHAHRSLVVHGDIKPSNVILAHDGSTRLVDFGVARLTVALDEDEMEGPYPLTEGYAAPERTRGEQPSVAGDVFSLGALLHEMLTGRRPDPDGRPASAVAAERPSRIPAGAIAGDLDAIVARATAPDPANRYPDAASLAADIVRHRQRRPVRARAPTAAYRTGRFVRRNRLSLGIAASVALLLAAATIVSLSLYLDARRQRASAEARFEEVRSLAKFQLFTLYDRLAAVPGTLAARARLSEEAQAYLDRLASLPDARDAVRVETATGYDRLAEIQGVPNSPNLGRTDAAKRNLDRAEAMLAPLAPADPRAKAELARNLLMQADMAIWQDNDVEAGERLLLRAEPLVAAVRDGGPQWRRLENRRRAVRLDVLGWSERYGEESAFAAGTLRWLETHPPAERDTPSWIIATAEARNARAEGDWYSGRRENALADAEAADALIRGALARWPERPELLSARVVSGYNLITSEPKTTKQKLLEQALEIAGLGRRLRAMEPNDALIAWRVRNAETLAAQFLAEAGRHGEAAAIQRRIVGQEEAKLARLPGDTRTIRDLAMQRKVLGSMEWHAGRRAAACALWRQAGAAFDGLERTGNLNEWDKSNVVAGLRRDLRGCG